MNTCPVSCLLRDNIFSCTSLVQWGIFLSAQFHSIPTATIGYFPLHNFIYFLLPSRSYLFFFYPSFLLSSYGFSSFVDFWGSSLDLHAPPFCFFTTEFIHQSLSVRFLPLPSFHRLSASWDGWGEGNRLVASQCNR